MSYIGGGGGGSGFLYTVGAGNTLNFYVSTTGSDSNPGTLAAPWATLQHALFYIALNVNFASGFVNVNVSAGTFVGAGMASCIGGGFLQILGAGSSLTTITAGPNDGVYNQGECASMYNSTATPLCVFGATIQPDSAGNGIINAAPASSLFLVRNDLFTADLIFDNTNGINYFVLARYESFLLDGGGTFTINFQGVNCQGIIEVEDASVYINTASWQTNGNTAFVQGGIKTANDGIYSPQNNSFTILTGTVTGPRFRMGTGGQIAGADPGTLGPTFLLGSTDGIFQDSTGNYDGFFGAANMSGPATTANIQTDNQEATFKDTLNGQRLVAFNDAGSIYVKQICRTINTQTGSYTMALSDQDGVVRMTGTGTFTVPQDSAFTPAPPPVGTEVRVTDASGTTTIAAGAGATVNNAGALVQWQTAILRKVAANTWDQTNV